MMVASGRVRRAARRDLDCVAAIWSEITDHHAGIDPCFTPRPNVEGEISALLVRQFADTATEIFVCERGDALLGFCAVCIRRAPPILVEVERGEITDLGVRRGARRGGIGRALAGAALGHAD